MRNIILYALILALILALTGCASVGDVLHQDNTPSQNYRLKGQEESISISGNIQKISGNWESYAVFNLHINNQIVINKARLEKLEGEAQGEWKGKNVQASCNPTRASDSWVDVKCTIFIENEKTVTLRF